MRYLLLNILLVCCILGGIWAQNICQNCVNNTNNNFTCNNMGCQGFQIETNNQYNFNPNKVMCDNPNGSNGGSNCFYASSINNSTVTYLFCNYTSSGCSSCPSSSTCSSCFVGLYLYTYDFGSGNQNCQSCSTAIPGCLYCSNQFTCTQCQYGYQNNGQNCVYLNGTVPNGLGLFTYEGGSSTVA